MTADTPIKFTAFFPISILIIFQLSGEYLASLTGIPLPGSILGGLLLLIALFICPGLYHRISGFSHLLIRNMLLFYVPASVGLSTIFPQLQSSAVAIMITVAISTLLTALVSALVFQFIERKIT